MAMPNSLSSLSLRSVLVVIIEKFLLSFAWKVYGRSVVIPGIAHVVMFKVSHLGRALTDGLNAGFEDGADVVQRTGPYLNGFVAG